MTRKHVAQNLDYPRQSFTISSNQSIKPLNLLKFIKTRAPAKINLCLDIIKKATSGYHKIQTVFQEIPKIYDEIKIETAKNKDTLSTIYGKKFQLQKTPIQKNDPLLNTTTNLAFRALTLLKKTYKKSHNLHKKFVKITIKKNIPISSGLGGASSDAAATLKGLNKLWNLKISTKKLFVLAAKLGMDVPFFIIGGTALGTNFGEKITPLPPLKNIKFKIFPRATASIDKTKSAYASLSLSKCGKDKSKTTELIKIIREQSKFSKKEFTKKLQENLHNDFETLSCNKNLPKNQRLSGSGPSTFQILP